MSAVERSDLIFSTVMIGLVDIAQAILPLLIYTFWATDWIKGVQLGVDFEQSYGQLAAWFNFAWKTMAYGHLTSYGISALLWPFSYIDSDSFTRVFYYSNLYSYYMGSLIVLVSFMLVTTTGL